MIYFGKSPVHVLLLASVKNAMSYLVWSEVDMVTGEAGDEVGGSVALSSIGTTVSMDIDHV